MLCLSLYKIGGLTTAERAKTVQTYCKNVDSVVGTFRALRVDYGGHNGLFERTIDIDVKEFKEDLLKPFYY